MASWASCFLSFKGKTGKPINYMLTLPQFFLLKTTRNQNWSALSNLVLIFLKLFIIPVSQSSSIIDGIGICKITENHKTRYLLHRRIRSINSSAGPLSPLLNPPRDRIHHFPGCFSLFQYRRGTFSEIQVLRKGTVNTDGWVVEVNDWLDLTSRMELEAANLYSSSYYPKTYVASVPIRCLYPRQFE